MLPVSSENGMTSTLKNVEGIDGILFYDPMPSFH